MQALFSHAGSHLSVIFLYSNPCIYLHEFTYRLISATKLRNQEKHLRRLVCKNEVLILTFCKYFCHIIFKVGIIFLFFIFYIFFIGVTSDLLN